MQTFKEFYYKDIEKFDGQDIEPSDTIPSMNEGLMKKALPYITAGLTGIGGMSHADMATNAASHPANLRVHKKPAHEIDREIKYQEYLDSLNKNKKPAPKSPATSPIIKKNTIDIDFKNLLPAIAKQESGGFTPTKRDHAIGDNGKAYGRYQVHKETVQDVNRIYGTHYTHQDMFNRTKAEDVLVKYLTFWGKYNLKHKGVKPTHSNLAAVWNGGPNGFKKQKAIQYAKWVLMHMNNINNSMYASN